MGWRGGPDREGQRNSPKQCSTQDMPILHELFPAEYNSWEMGIRGAMGKGQRLSTFLQVIPGVIHNSGSFPLFSLCLSPTSFLPEMVLLI